MKNGRPNVAFERDERRLSSQRITGKNRWSPTWSIKNHTAAVLGRRSSSGIFARGPRAVGAGYYARHVCTQTRIHAKRTVLSAVLAPTYGNVRRRAVAAISGICYATLSHDRSATAVTLATPPRRRARTTAFELARNRRSPDFRRRRARRAGEYKLWDPLDARI